MNLGLGLLADPVKKRLWGRRPVDPEMVANALADEARRLLPEIAPAIRRTGDPAGIISLTLIPVARPVAIARAAGGRLAVSAETGALGPGYHEWLVDALTRIADREGFEWHEQRAGDDGALRDETGHFASRDGEQLRFRFREQMAVRMGELLDVWGNVPEAHRFGLPLSLRPAEPEEALFTLRGPRLRVFAELSRGGDETEARAIFPWWDAAGDDGFTPATALALAESLLWCVFPWRAPLDPAERAAGEAARALLNRAGPGEAGDMPIDELETLLAAKGPMPLRDEGPGYLRGRVERVSAGGWRLHVPGHFRPAPPDERHIEGWWFDGREVHVWSPPVAAARPDAGIDRFDAEALLKAADTEIAFVRGGAFYSGEISMHRGPSGSAPELSGEVRAEGGFARIWVLFRGPDDSSWVLDTFRSLRPPGA